jgi:type IV pilus assembly protein PilP
MRKITLITLIIITGLLSTDGLFAGEARKTLPLLPAKAAKVPQQVSAPQTSAPQQSAPAILPAESVYSYNPAGKPDPFRPFAEEEIVTKKKQEKKGVISIYPLQRTEVDRFRLEGITGDQSRRVAIVVEDATKKHYPLVVGTHIGVNNGKVIEILPDRVIVEEFKEKKANRIILKLHKN